MNEPCQSGLNQWESFIYVTGLFHHSYMWQDWYIIHICDKTDSSLNCDGSVLSHMWMPLDESKYVHMDESPHASRIWFHEKHFCPPFILIYICDIKVRRWSHGTHMNELCHRYEYFMSQMGMRTVMHMNESCHTYEWGMSHILMHHDTGMNELSRMWICHVPPGPS